MSAASAILEAADKLQSQSRHGPFPSGLLEVASQQNFNSAQAIYGFALSFIKPPASSILLKIGIICTIVASFKVILATYVLVVRLRQGKLRMLREVRTQNGSLSVPYTFNAFFICEYCFSWTVLVWLALLTAGQVQVTSQIPTLTPYVYALWIFMWWPLYTCFLYGTVGSCFTIIEAFAQPVPMMYHRLPPYLLRIATIGIVGSPVPALVCSLYWSIRVGSRVRSSTTLLMPMMDSLQALEKSLVVDADVVIQLLTDASRVWDAVIEGQQVVHHALISWIILALLLFGYILPRMVSNIWSLRSELIARRGISQGLNRLLHEPEPSEHRSAKSAGEIAATSEPPTNPIDREAHLSEDEAGSALASVSIKDTKAFSLLVPSAESSPFWIDQAPLPDIEEEQLPVSADLDEVSSPRFLQAVRTQRQRAAASRTSSAMRDCLFILTISLAEVFTVSAALTFAFYVLLHGNERLGQGPREGALVMEITWSITCIAATFSIVGIFGALCMRLLDENSTDYIGKRRLDRDEGYGHAPKMEKRNLHHTKRLRLQHRGSTTPEMLGVQIEQTIYIC